MKINWHTINVLVTSNPLNHEGGVVNYYNILFKKNCLPHIKFIHSSIGSSQHFFYFPLIKRILYIIQYFISVIVFIYKLIFYKIHIVQLNPSLIPVPIFRDFPLIIISKIFHKKCIVFFRGWKENTYNLIKNKKLLKFLFVRMLNFSDKIFVLSYSFKAELVDLGINKNKIFRTTTVIDEDKIIPVDPLKNFNKEITFLYLGRISKLKGIDELTDAINILFELNPELFSFVKFIFIGHEDKKGYTDTLQSKLQPLIQKQCVEFLGRIENHDKYLYLHNSDIYIFPSWSEGCPNSVLEALASGLFVISTDVGALKDIIIENENGIFVEKKNASDLVNKIHYAINNIDIIRNKKIQIQQKALREFSSRQILLFLEQQYKSLL
ncbi:MAG: glycosyltransferase family 4 protein [Bacteroidales bacterium]|nr:glycosyltransferase family 4 protein [Bacteroidales bacterium]